MDLFLSTSPCVLLLGVTAFNADDVLNLVRLPSLRRLLNLALAYRVAVTASELFPSAADGCE